MLCREQALDLTDGLLYTQSQRVSVDLLRIFYPNWWGLPPLRPLNETIVFWAALRRGLAVGDYRVSDVFVSFVVPAYNEEALIGSCLTAIIAEISRTGCRAEIIVVNNGSTDSTCYIASSYPNVTVVDEPVRGLVRARRAGCLEANGKFIANIDADTILPEGWLNTALAEFVRRPGLVALSGPYIYYDLPKWAQLAAAGFYRGAHIAHLLSRLLAGRGSVMQGGNFIVSRSALEAAGGFNPDYQFYGEDAELARRLSKVGVVKFTRALCALSSGRRFVGEGIFIVLLRYSANYFWTHLFKHPWSSAWLDVRHATGVSGGLSNLPRQGPDRELGSFGKTR
jgi:glycosyltransferase involved in cell wall biosynthesis